MPTQAGPVVPELPRRYLKQKESKVKLWGFLKTKTDGAKIAAKAKNCSVFQCISQIIENFRLSDPVAIPLLSSKNFETVLICQILI
jgi:hypothetical protein